MAKKKKNNTSRPKIYERNPNTGVIRWRYVGESHEKFGWPNYGRILKQKKNTTMVTLSIHKKNKTLANSQIFY